MIKHPFKTWVEISKSALVHNVKQFRELIKKKTQLIAVVKSNAYGHGLEQVVPIFSKAGVRWFAVDSIDEALRVKNLCPQSLILILGYTLQNRLIEAIKNDFRLTVYNPETIRALGQITNRLKKTVHLHLKCETGTARQGVLMENLAPLAKLVGSFKYLVLEGLSTHYANIEDTTNHSYAEKQLAKFKQMNQILVTLGIKIPMKHASCSAAAILFPETHFNAVRVGIGLYGLWPSAETIISASEKNKKINLQPALTWKTCVAQIKPLPRGYPISYGLTEELTRDSKLAILPIGYWDGYDRRLSSNGIVLINGHRARVVGRICMNMMMVDVTDIRGVKLENEVALIGREGRGVLSAEDLAKKLDTINYEIVTRINPTIPRIIVD